MINSSSRMSFNKPSTDTWGSKHKQTLETVTFLLWRNTFLHWKHRKMVATLAPVQKQILLQIHLKKLKTLVGVKEKKNKTELLQLVRSLWVDNCLCQSPFNFTHVQPDARQLEVTTSSYHNLGIFTASTPEIPYQKSHWHATSSLLPHVTFLRVLWTFRPP